MTSCCCVLGCCVTLEGCCVCTAVRSSVLGRLADESDPVPSGIERSPSLRQRWKVMPPAAACIEIGAGVEERRPGWWVGWNIPCGTDVEGLDGAGASVM